MIGIKKIGAKIGGNYLVFPIFKKLADCRKDFNDKIKILLFIVLLKPDQKAEETAGSTQALFSFNKVINSSTATPSGTFLFTTSFPLYKVIFPGPLPT